MAAAEAGEWRVGSFGGAECVYLGLSSLARLALALLCWEALDTAWVSFALVLEKPRAVCLCIHLCYYAYLYPSPPPLPHPLASAPFSPSPRPPHNQKNAPTLAGFVMKNTKDKDLVILMNAIALSCKQIATAVKRAGIAKVSEEVELFSLSGRGRSLIPPTPTSPLFSFLNPPPAHTHSSTASRATRTVPATTRRCLTS